MADRNDEKSWDQNQPKDVIANLIHDVRQPLSTIEACTYYLKLTLARENRAVRVHLDLIENQLAEVSQILSDIAQGTGTAQKAKEGPAPAAALTTAV